MGVKEVRCPTCRRQTTWDGNPHRPFCSERCRVLDLGNWATGRYRITGPPADALPGEQTDGGDDDEDE
jgi:endogenous inhibitor of DNA gyrase (YacG/DUF329 family)